MEAFVERRRRDAARLTLPLRAGKRYYLEGLAARLAARPTREPRPRCVAVRSHLRILPNGGVPVCQSNTEAIGNVVRDGFEADWRSDRANRARQWVDRCAGCWAECEVVPSAIYSGDLARHALRDLVRPRATAAG